VSDEQIGAPFKHVRERSPEPAEVATQLEYEDLAPESDDWMLEDLDPPAEELTDDDEELNYEATSMTDELEHVCGSVGSSPGFFERRVVSIDKKRPPGIAVTFDDDSWIV
jgi:hypothetical protein